MTYRHHPLACRCRRHSIPSTHTLKVRKQIVEDEYRAMGRMLFGKALRVKIQGVEYVKR